MISNLHPPDHLIILANALFPTRGRVLGQRSRTNQGYGDRYVLAGGVPAGSGQDGDSVRCSDAKNEHALTYSLSDAVKIVIKT